MLGDGGTGFDLRDTIERCSDLVKDFPNGAALLFGVDLEFVASGGSKLDSIVQSESSLVGSKLEDAFPEEVAEALRPLYRDSLDGTTRTIEISVGDALFIAQTFPVEVDGNIVGGWNIFHDVTERRNRREELQSARQRYETLLQSAPDPIFVARVETGEIIEANETAAEILGKSREEIIGMHQTDLHPAGDEQLYGQLFEEHAVDGGAKRFLPDGSQIYLATTGGQKVPVEISVAKTTITGEEVMYGVFRDVSEQIEYEQTVAGLYKGTEALFDAESVEGITSAVIDTVTEILGVGYSAVYLYNEEEGVLELEDCRTATAGAPEDQFPENVLEGGPAWQSFLSKTSTKGIGDEFQDVPGIIERDDTGIVTPIGKWGVLITGHETLDGPTNRSADLLEILGAVAESAYDSTEREQHLREQEELNEQRTEQLELVESLNGQIRDVAEVIVDSDSRAEIEEAVCDHLVAEDSFDFVWIGGLDLVENRLEPRAHAGQDKGYLETLSLDLDGDPPFEPSIESATTNEPVVVQNTAADLESEGWRRNAVTSGFKSVMSIPLKYQGRFKGVLTIFSRSNSAFSGLLRSVLIELGELIAHGVVSIHRKDALLTNQSTELDFSIRDEACFFLRYTRRTNRPLQLEGIIPQVESSYLVFVRVRDSASEKLLVQARQAPEVNKARLIESDGDSALLQLQFVKPFIASRLADHGITVDRISGDGSQCLVTVSVPTTFDLRQVVDVVTTNYPESELIAKREQSKSIEAFEDITHRALQELTPRQREVGELALLRGYFESPKGATGKELAEELGISSSAFHKHIREAERKLFKTIFEEKSSYSYD